jgi:tetratricopeptide (TPR) repeat protein
MRSFYRVREDWMTRTIASRGKQRSAGRFVGRFAEQQMFRATLRQLAALRERGDDELTDEELSYAQIFLVAAEGGMGKTTLLRRFEAIVNEEGAGAQALYLDWEHYAPIDSPDKFMSVLHDALCAAGFKSQMQPYRDAITRRAEAQRKAADAEEKYKSLVDFGDRAAQIATGGIVDKDMVVEGIQKKLDPDEWKLYDDPDALTETFMATLNAIAIPRRPLALLLDTYELADRCDNWLRKRALPQSNPRLVWALAGREGQPFIRRYEDEFDARLLGRMLLDTFARPDIVVYLQQCGIADPADELVERLQALSRGIPLALEGWFNLYQKQVELPPPDPAMPTTRRAIVRQMTDRFLRYCNEDDRHLAPAERKARETIRSQILALMLLRRTDVAALAAAWQCGAAQAEAALNDLADQFSFIFAQEIEREPHALVKEFLREHLRDQVALPIAIQEAVARLVVYFEQRMRERERQLAPSEVAPTTSPEDKRRAALLAERAAHQSRLDQLNTQLAEYGLAAPPHIRTDRDHAASAIAEIDARLVALGEENLAPAAPRQQLWSDEAWRDLLLDRLNVLCWADRGGERAMRLLVPLFVEALEFDRAAAGELLATVQEFAGRWTPDLGRLFMLMNGGFQEEKLLSIFDRLLTDAEHWHLTALQGAILHVQRGRSLLGPRYGTTAEGRAAAWVAADEAAQLLPVDGGELAQTLAALYKRVGKIYLWPKRFVFTASPEGVSTLVRAIRYVAQDQDAWYCLGAAYQGLMRYEEAITALQEAIRIAPTIAISYTALGSVYTDLQMYDKALATYQRAIELDPTDDNPHNGLGNMYRRHKQYIEAINAYHRAIELNPTHAGLYSNLAYVLFVCKQYEEALEAYQRAITLDPPYLRAYMGLGNLYHSHQQYEEAITAYQEAIRLDPTWAAPHDGLGNIYRDRKQYEEATAAYQEAIRLDPTWAAPHDGLGNIYRDRKQYEEAITAYQDAIRLNSAWTTPHIGLGKIYSLFGRNDEARAAYQQALEINPESYRSMYCLARVERQVGNQAQATAWIERARPLLPSDAFYDRACLESIAGDADAAIEALRTALEQGSSVEWARQDPDLAFIRDDPRYRALVGLDRD